MAKTKHINISDSLEDYLEAIFFLIQQKQAARAKDIGRQLGVSRPSVTGALHALADRNLVNYSPYGIITLTQQGQAIAREVYRRHEILRDFFVKILDVEYSEADSAACKMEHVISDAVLKKFLNFIEKCSRPDL
ncbi:MAG TPA: metal-dependent transcriptional regulator [Phycisphaerae bacterium]|nr:metal-dependent transcriptional regulator [Phycisphaerae bacterium]HPS52051.1 metal-dependent transcriptional regulator [Phycisphaerae bacterium]